MRKHKRASLLAVPVVLAMTAFGTLNASASTAAAAHQPSPSGSAASATPATPADPSKIDDPGQVLPASWRTSKDRAVTTIGDDNGLNVLVADSSSAYQWRTAASLSEPGVDTPQWIGQDCVTGSGNYAAVVYAPWSFSNNADEFDHGAFAAIVNLNTGAVRKLPDRVSLSYYSPGCGSGDTVAFSALNADTATTTTSVELVDAVTGAVQQKATVPGQVTSPVPYAGGMAAALGDSVISISPRGRVATLAAVGGIAFRLHPDDQGGLAFEVPTGRSQVQVRRIATGSSTLVGAADLGQVELQGSAGRVFLTGPQAPKIKLGARPVGGWTSVGGAAGSTPSTEGGLLVSSVSNHVDAETLGAEKSDAVASGSAAAASAAAGDAAQDAIAIDATVVGTGKHASFTVQPSALIPAAGSAASPALDQLANPVPATPAKAPVRAAAKAPVRAAATGSTHSIVNADDSADPAAVTWDPQRGCAVARNDPGIQTFQASAQQVEWAADLAVMGDLKVSRPANWEGSGMPVSWTPQGMFPMRTVDGGGGVPVQVLLGILAQESNTMQASPHAVDGLTGNFNQGGFYGNPSDTVPAPGTTWSDVDCGYGVGQVTTGMTIGTTGQVADGSSAYTTAEEQQAIATDYASNIAATLNMLIDKWNQLYTAGILANGGSSQYIENWWFAVWAYNSGVQPTSAYGNTTGCTPGPTCTDTGGSGGNWGLGWSNNPADPGYPADRSMFDGQLNQDASNPQQWTYPEKVVGWAAYPVARLNYSAGSWAPAYAAGSWPNNDPAAAEPPLSTFCVMSVNDCEPDAATDVTGAADKAGLCTLSDFHCWWHEPVNWMPTTAPPTSPCSTLCGVEVMTYGVSQPEPTVADIHPPDGCTASGGTGDTLPGNAVVVDGAAGPACAGQKQSWKSGGTLSFDFPASEISSCTSDCITYQGKIDFHQLGEGLNGHMWFSHMINTPDDNGTSFADDSMTATWTPPSSTTGWNRIEVHVPDNGATTQQADYQIYTNTGASQHRLVDQHLQANDWVDLGSFDLAAGAHVSLSNYNTRVASTDGGDVAFDAVAFIPTPKPTVQYVALGDSYSSGESNQPYLLGSDETFSGNIHEACHRSPQAYSYGLEMPGAKQTIQAEAAGNGAADFAFLACSGAETVDLTASAVTPGNTWNTDWGNTDANYSDYGELLQVDDSGYLDQNTTLVTLSAGGNDGRFPDVLQGCVDQAVDCTASNFYLTRVPPAAPTVDPAPLTVYEPEVITALQTHLEAVYTAIHKLAPNAAIVVLGYPQLFPTDATTCTSPSQRLLNVNDMNWMNQMSVSLDQSISTAVSTVAGANAGLDIKFVNPTAVFSGHDICSSTPWINGIINWDNSGSGYTAPGVGSFHPMAVGQAAEATLINGILP